MAGIRRAGLSWKPSSCWCGTRCTVPVLGQEAHYHESRRKQLLTMLGPVVFDRAYYLCAGCHQGQSPRDRELDVVGTECSPGVRRMMAVVGSESSFHGGREQLLLLAGFEVTTKPSNATRKPSGPISSDGNRTREIGWCNWSFPTFWGLPSPCTFSGSFKTEFFDLAGNSIGTDTGTVNAVLIALVIMERPTTDSASAGYAAKR